MSPDIPPNASPRSSPNFGLARSAAMLILTAMTSAGGMLMIGPQIMVIVPVAIAAGIVFALRNSSIANANATASREWTRSQRNRHRCRSSYLPGGWGLFDRSQEMPQDPLGWTE